VSRARTAGVAASAVLAAILGAAGAPAAPPLDAPPSACEPAYEGVQLMRQRGKLVAAREQAAVCARDTCPEVARKDCARWAEELAREIPTVVVVARDDADHDVPVARLLVDGVARQEVASGRAFELDPGAHVFRVERAAGPPVERSFTVYEGERDRMLRIAVPQVAVEGPRAVPPYPAYSANGAPRAPAAPTGERPSIVPAAVVGGLSVVALATSAFLGLTGRQQLDNLRSTCAPACTDDQVNPVRTRLVVSDVTLGVGLVGAAIAVSLFALRGTF
jgi:hypothetical protein